MRKIVSLLLALCLSFSLCFALASCYQSKPDKRINLMEYNVGDVLPVTPDETQNFTISETCALTNISIKATLAEKNIIDEQDTANLGGNNSFVVEIQAEGTLTGTLGQLCYIYIEVRPSFAAESVYIQGTVMSRRRIVFSNRIDIQSSHVEPFLFGFHAYPHPLPFNLLASVPM